MLCELHIRDYALMDELDITFGKGMTVLTGETGGGKSIIVGAVGLVLGERADQDVIRAGADGTSVEGVFDLSGFPQIRERLQSLEVHLDDSMLYLRRTLNRGGRSRCFVNGHSVPIVFLKQIGDEIVDLHGQHSHQSLLKTERHLDLLDSFAGLGEARAEVADLFGRLESLRRERDEAARRLAQLEEKRELYQFQVDEIDRARLRKGEREELEAEHKVLRHAERLALTSDQVCNLLSDDEPSASSILSQALRLLSDAAEIDDRLRETAEMLRTTSVDVEEAARLVADYRSRIAWDPGRLEEIDDRLQLLKSLERKYGGSIEAVLQYGERIAAELQSLDRGEEDREELEATIAELERQYGERAEALSRARSRAARDLAKRVERELDALGMSRARFGVQLEKPVQGAFTVAVGADRYGATERGIDQAEFVLSANPGEPLRPLHKIASGGEISRIMLALKTILANVDSVPTLVFDEIDVGIGGRTAERVGTRLRAIANERQVICITHLPQIASLGDHHFEVKKVEAGGRTVTTVHVLSDDERVAEIARMLGGSKITETVLKHAREMVSARSSGGADAC
ncbi:hypothetical protein AMJ39_02990 [candidate division TA06 bacterium DG_24]|uniref:DNA repair protein RecN n=1 Tax=candidate division TA06 bacterium DG_24 TaxID=1703770 RepID=A0A0S7WUL5_UNCT6|nr:MAG: hypothetical protein AMJ39_02990 [candidate division TA06 bacterium DG_24]